MNKILIKTFHFIKWIFLGVLLLFTILVLFIRSPFGQNIIKEKITSFVADKINTDFQIKRLYLTFTGNLILEELYLEDQQQDTLLYSKRLEVSTSILPIITKNKIKIKSVEWQGLKANVRKKDSLHGYNFDYILKAFSDSEATEVEKDTTTVSPEIKIGKLDFSDFDLRFKDLVMGVDTHLKLKNLKLSFGKKFNLKTSHFPVEEFRISTTNVEYLQTKPFAASQDSEAEATLPYVEIDDLEFENIVVAYQNKVDKTSANVNLGVFKIENTLLDLTKKHLGIGFIGLNNTSANIVLLNSSKPNQETNDLEAEKTDFVWPDWRVKLQKLNFKNNDIAVKTGESITKKGIFNPENIKVTNSNILLQDVALESKRLRFHFKEVSFVEQSGFVLNKLNLNARINDRKTEISSFEVATNYNELLSTLELKYASVNDLINNPEKSKFAVNINKAVLNPKDAFYFKDSLQQNKILNKFSKQNLTGNLNLEGNLENIKVNAFNFSWGASTSVGLNGTIKNGMLPDSLFVDIPDFQLKTKRKDLLKLIQEDSLGIRIPNEIALTSKVNGTFKGMKTQTELKTSDGTIKLQGLIQNKELKAFEGKLNVSQLQLGKILKNEQIGLLDFTSELKLLGKDIQTLSANINTTFNSLVYNEYNYKPLQLNVEIKDGKGVVNTTFKDDNLDFEMKTNLQLDSLTSNVKTNISIKGINCQGLGLTQKNIKARIDVAANLKNTSEGLNLKAQTENGLIIYNEESIPISNFDIDTKIANDSTLVTIESDLINFKMTSNKSPEIFMEAVNNHLQSYFKINPKNNEESVVQNTMLNASFTLTQNPLLDQVFLEGLESFEPLHFDFKFSEANQSMISTFDIPHIEYQGSNINNAIFSLNSSKEDFNLSFNVDNIKYNPIDIQNLSLQGNVKEEVLHLDFFTSDASDKIININTEISKTDKAIEVHVHPLNLIFNKKPWKITESNKIVLENEKVIATDFTLSRNQQSLKLWAEADENSNQIFGIDFDDFDLINLLSFLNTENELASGLVSGKVETRQLDQAHILTSDLEINQLNVLQTPLGLLKLNAKTVDNKNVDVELSLKDSKNIDLEVAGSYNSAIAETPLNLDVKLNRLGLSTVASFAKDYISNPSGNLSANFKMKGSFAKPIYDGNVNFNNAKLKVKMFNTDFTLPEESIKVDNSSIVLQKFSIFDSNKNAFVLDGKVTTDEITNPKFDLTLKTNGLQVLNSTEKDNDLYYGKLFLDTDLKIGGDLNIPKISGTLKINKDTDFTYVIPETTVDAVERDGVVIFVNKKIKNSVLTSNTEEESSSKVLTGLDIETILEIDKNAVLNVVVDKKTGDNLKLQGTANLNFGMNPNGITTLSGKYEVKDGHYEASLYNLVKRKFDIAKGSTITWQGDPIDANMDIKAIYKVQASASGLMAAVTSGLEVSELNQYRKKMPFWVYLNLGGELLKPEISFDLDIPEESRGELGGQVYIQVQQLNNREEELNKQVFSLLVLNQFFSSNMSDGSSGGSLSIARNNVNKVLSNQLNNYSNKLVGNTGIELDFELDSYTDYTDSGEENNTQLNVSAQKRLFNDRLTVQVGSGFEIENNAASSDEKTPIIGNVKIEYALTENRRYRLKGFRKNEFESVIDGQVVATGIALLFNREFNKFRELFSKETSESK
ncbi:translocation/assembly module TamB domain-containing protein [Wenyingzhuangia sp. 1_MG-2023]|nr:translocation/assembly module TamB domain-containing protein [Wenyingzhuangia sp. 1_MG-2023]